MELMVLVTDAIGSLHFSLQADRNGRDSTIGYLAFTCVRFHDQELKLETLSILKNMCTQVTRGWSESISRIRMPGTDFTMTQNSGTTVGGIGSSETSELRVRALFTDEGVLFWHKSQIQMMVIQKPDINNDH
jgi:hypothetical protein